MPMKKQLNFAVPFQTWSCWASWFSSPSTIEANLSLLFLSAAMVMAARILSRLGENRGMVNGPDTTVNKQFYHLDDRTFTRNFQLKHPVSSCIGLFGPFLGLLLQRFCMQVRMFGATRSNFKFNLDADRVSVCVGVEISFAGECDTTWSTS